MSITLYFLFIKPGIKHPSALSSALADKPYRLKDSYYRIAVRKSVSYRAVKIRHAEFVGKRLGKEDFIVRFGFKRYYIKKPYRYALSPLTASVSSAYLVLDTSKLVFDGECPMYDKFDEYIPAELLRAAYAVDRLSPDEVEERFCR